MEQKHIHILGICGTFMGGVAVIARQLGFKVTGSDLNIYPPMSDTLQAAGIEIIQGYDPKQFQPVPDMVLVGNALSRGNPALEYILDHKIPYNSGPQWLAENCLHNRHVLAVSGTHGKTTTTSMLTWILTEAGLKPGYLIGGVANGFKETAFLGESNYFVIEADEYDSAFFDKRSKFVHYRPQTLIINNIEFDHADIFDDLEAIFRQFQIVLRTVPSNGTVIYSLADENIPTVLKRGCYAKKISFGLNQGDFQAQDLSDDGSHFSVFHHGKFVAKVQLPLIGQHNAANALAAIAAAFDVGVSPATAIAALNKFPGVKRRMEVRGRINDITVYDDFAHHPTAIKTTLDGLRAKVKNDRIVAVLQFGSNTMKMGHHKAQIAKALATADQVILLKPDQWEVDDIAASLKNVEIFANVKDIIHSLLQTLKPNDHVLIMSNKGFDGIHQKLLDGLQTVC